MAPISDLVDRRFVLGALTGLAVGSSVSAAPAPGGPDLSRGVNLSHWFAQSFEGYGQDHLDRFVTREDVRRIAAAGFSHVRLGFEPDIVFGHGSKPALNEPVVAQLADAIAMIMAERLCVVLDMHPVGASKDRYLTPEGADRLVANWALLARRLASLDTDRVAFEILNEPEPLRGDVWWQLQSRAVAAIRTADRLRTIIVNPGGWSGVDDLLGRIPYEQDRLVYTVHHYAPLLFTHQGADWTWDVAKRVAALDWPIAPDAAGQASKAATSLDSDRATLRDQIAHELFTPEALAQQFDHLATWSEHHGKLPIYVGEFGVYVKAAPRQARLRWLAASRDAFERHGWGWAIWDNSRDFGFITAGGAIDQPTLQALRLEGA